MNNEPLHPAQDKLLKLLADNAESPLSVRELQDHIDAKSPSVVTHHLQQLERKGYIKKNPYNPRDYQVFRSPEVGVTHLNLYGMAQCGPNGSILDGNPIDRIPISSKLLTFAAKDAFMVKAKGRSMEPKIHEGDLVIARKTSNFENGKVFVCINDSECLIKRVRILDDNIWLESFNEVPIFKAAPDFHVEGEVKSIISGKI